MPVFYFFTALRCPLVNVERQHRHSFGKDTDTGIHRRSLHRRPLVDRFSRRRITEQKIPPAARAVLRFVAGTEQAFENIQISSPPKIKHEKSTAGAMLRFFMVLFRPVQETSRQSVYCGAGFKSGRPFNLILRNMLFVSEPRV